MARWNPLPVLLFALLMSGAWTVAPCRCAEPCASGPVAAMAKARQPACPDGCWRAPCCQASVPGSAARIVATLPAPEIRCSSPALYRYLPVGGLDRPPWFASA
jgi:hypothetical protein